MAVNSFVDKFFKKVLGSNSDVFLKKVTPDRRRNQRA